MWKHHFGAGIVASLGNFGKTGTPPTHPELLDWLAREFVRSGWRAKPMHRLMVTSRAYRQSSAVAAEASKADPTNALISRMPMVRLDAESLYDAILLASGRLEERRFGPPDPVEARDDGLATPKGTSAGWRRMIYVQQMRKRIATHLENFDFPQMNPNCIERRDSTVAPQALHLMNNGMVEQLADAFAGRVLREAGLKPEAVVERVHWLALTRAPTTEERAAGVDAIRALSAAWKQASPGGGDEAASHKALATYCHAILNSAAFLYVD